MKPILIVVLVDALGWTLVGEDPGFAPVLPERRALATVLGFSSGALPTAFTGKLARDHGRWLMYRRAPAGGGVFRGLEWLRWLPTRLRRSWRLTQWLTRQVAERVGGYFNLYDVPREELPLFDLPEQRDIFVPGGLPCDSLWDSLERRGLSWRGWNWRTSEPEARTEALAEIERGGRDLVFVYSAVLDARLHHEGSRGAGVRANVAEWSRWFDDASSAARRAGREPWLYLCSDHGMVDVIATVDVMGALHGLPFERGRDYLAFFDSTMARFWWHTAAARDAVRGALGNRLRGRWLEPQDLVAAGADFADQRYGEDVFLLEPGVLMVPSYMGRTPLAAMHGYDPSHPDMPGVLMSNRPLPAAATHLAHLRGFLEAELDALKAAGTGAA
jgi:hypothetical protein